MRLHFGKFTVALFIALNATAAGAQQNPSSGSCAVAGPADAPLTIEEYADFECSYCVRGSRMANQALRDFPNQIKLVFRNMPLPFHQNALSAAKAFTAICLQNPTKAHEFKNELFENQSQLEERGEAYLYELASKHGIGASELKRGMASAEVDNAIKFDQQEAARLGFKGTPSFLIGNEPVQGAIAYSEFKRIIQKQLNKE